MSLAAIIILACFAMGLISRPEVAEFRVSWYSRRSSGSSSFSAWHHGKHTERHYYDAFWSEYVYYVYLQCTDISVNYSIYFSQYLQNNGGIRLSVSHSHSARDGFKLRNHSWSDIPVYLDLSKHTWPSHKTGGNAQIHTRIFTLHS